MQLNEKVVTLKNPAIKPKGAPTDKARAFDKVHPKTGRRPDRSVLKAIARDQKYLAVEGSNEGEYMEVLVMGGAVPEIDVGNKYFGVNVIFMADGSVTQSIADDISRKQWSKDKDLIIAAARKYWKAGTIEAFVERGGDADMNEGKVTFKMFLLTEGKRNDVVKPHKYSVKLTQKGKGRFPSLKGEIYENDVMIGRFSRAAVKDGYVPPIEHKFLSSQAKARFDDFADSNSIAETIEALLP